MCQLYYSYLSDPHQKQPCEEYIGENVEFNILAMDTLTLWVRPTTLLMEKQLKVQHKKAYFLPLTEFGLMSAPINTPIAFVMALTRRIVQQGAA